MSSCSEQLCNDIFHNPHIFTSNITIEHAVQNLNINHIHVETPQAYDNDYKQFKSPESLWLAGHVSSYELLFLETVSSKNDLVTNLSVEMEKIHKVWCWSLERVLGLVPVSVYDYILGA